MNYLNLFPDGNISIFPHDMLNRQIEQIYVPGMIPAVSAEVILYRLDEEGNPTTDPSGKMFVVTVNGSPYSKPTPQTPMAFIRSYLKIGKEQEGDNLPLSHGEAWDELEGLMLFWENKCLSGFTCWDVPTDTIIERIKSEFAAGRFEEGNVKGSYKVMIDPKGIFSPLVILSVGQNGTWKYAPRRGTTYPMKTEFRVIQ